MCVLCLRAHAAVDRATGATLGDARDVRVHNMTCITYPMISNNVL